MKRLVFHAGDGNCLPFGDFTVKWLDTEKKFKSYEKALSFYEKINHEKALWCNNELIQSHVFTEDPSHVVVFISDPSRIEIHTLEQFNDNWNKNHYYRYPIVYTEIFHDSEEKCIEFCRKHKLLLNE